MKNRRSFISDIIKAGVGAMVLPFAATYARTWKPTENGIYVLNYEMSADAGTRTSFTRMTPTEFKRIFSMEGDDLIPYVLRNPYGGQDIIMNPKHFTTIEAFNVREARSVSAMRCPITGT